MYTTALVWAPTVHNGSGSLSQEFRAWCPCENLYEYYLVIISESLEELQERLIFGKTDMKGKGLRVNMGKTRVLISGPGLDVLQKFSRDLCAVCVKSIFCGGYSSWVHNRGNGTSGALKPDPSFRCKRCTWQARLVDGRPMTEVRLDREKRNLGRNFIGSASPATQWRDCDPLDVQYHHQKQVTSQNFLERIQLGDRAMTLHTRRFRWSCITLRWLGDESPEIQSNRRSWMWSP